MADLQTVLEAMWAELKLTTKGYAQMPQPLPQGHWRNARTIYEQQVLPLVQPAPVVSSLAPKLGVFLGNANASRLPLYDSWLGKPTEYVLDFGSSDSWANAMCPSWVTDKYVGGSRTPVVSIPLPGGDFDGVISGAHDADLQTCGRNMAAHFPNGILRLWWEMNGNWYPWFAGKDPAKFVAAWLRAYQQIKNAASTVRVLWCPNRLGSNVNGVAFDWAKAWPGPEYVDMIGVDAYFENWPTATDPVKAWASIFPDVQRLMNHAKANSKPFFVGEWGTEPLRTDGSGAGDQPDLISWFIRDVLNDSNTLGACYFDVQASDGHHALSKVTMDGTATDNPEFAKSAARYRQVVNA